jgi:HK97 family phage prohead protease
MSYVDKPDIDNSISGKKKLNGFASVYNVEADMGGWYIESILPGAFREVIKKADCRLLFNHSPDHIFGRTTNRTLRLSESRRGLIFWVDLLFDDPQSDALFARIRRRDISGCSFSCIIGQDNWDMNSGPLPRRTIIKIAELFDVGPVTYPAYPTTSVTAIVEEKVQQSDDDDDFDDDDFDDEDFDDEEIDFSRKKLVEKNYRKAGRIINRNKQWA